MHDKGSRRPIRIPRRQLFAILCLAVLGMCLHSVAYAISYSVYAGSTAIGQVSVNTLESGVYGGFTSTYGSPRSLTAAAQLGSDHHFNWFQVVIADNDPPNGANGVLLTPPYPDPPPGGYGSPDTHWADGLPWLWDEGADPPGGTPGFEDGYNLNDVIYDDNPVDGVKEFLFYEDFPGGFPGSSVTFRTWLVSLSSTGALNDFHDGFQWTWSNPGGGDGASQIQPTLLTPAQGLALYNQVVLQPGDFNQDGTVNAADYVTWRKTNGTPANYNLWRANFGKTLGSGSGAGATANSAAPEPTTAFMLIVGLLAIRFGGRPAKK